jgi:hypothetical protein
MPIQTPDAEVALAVADVLARPQCLDPREVAAIYRHQGLSVIPDPSAIAISEQVIRALQGQQPLSAIRIGDGEANLLTHQAYATPNLNSDVGKLILSMQNDSLEATEIWLKRLARIMHRSILEADIVGVRGLWLSKGDPFQKQEARAYGEQIRTASSTELRGLMGVWRATDYLLQLGQEGVLQNKLICSAHFYLSILANLERILAHTSCVYLITERSDLLPLFARRFPGIDFQLIPVGNLRGAQTSGQDRSRQLAFLGSTFRRIPRTMAGTLSLVGAGVWAELYCTWIRRRGGVGVDIGSGMDLLAGQCTRPVHRNWGLHEDLRYSLSKPPIPQGPQSPELTS